MVMLQHGDMFIYILPLICCYKRHGQYVEWAIV